MENLTDYLTADGWRSDLEKTSSDVMKLYSRLNTAENGSASKEGIATCVGACMGTAGYATNEVSLLIWGVLICGISTAALIADSYNH